MNMLDKLKSRSQALLNHPLWPILHRLGQRRAVRIGLNITVVLLALLFLAYGIYSNWNELGRYEWTLDYRYLLLAAALYGICFAVVALAWHLVMARVGTMPNLGMNLRIYCYSCLPKRIPGSIWFVASRVHLYKEQGVSRSITLLVMALETALLILSALVVYLLSLLFSPPAGVEEQPPLGVVLFLLPFFLLLLTPPVFNRLVSWLLRRLHSEATLSLTLGSGVRFVAIYMLAWILGGVDLYFMANAVYPVPPDLLPSMIGHWALAGALGLTAAYLIQGIGVSEVSLSVLLSGYLPLPIAIVIVILFRILLTVGEVVWALLPLGGALVYTKLTGGSDKQRPG